MYVSKQSREPQIFIVDANSQNKYKMANRAVIVPKINEARKTTFPILLINRPILSEHLKSLVPEKVLIEEPNNTSSASETYIKLLPPDQNQVEPIESPTESLFFLKEEINK